MPIREPLTLGELTSETHGVFVNVLENKTHF